MLVQIVQHFRSLFPRLGALVRLLGLLNSIEVVAELIKLILAQCIAQIDDESHWEVAIDVLMGSLTDPAQVMEELVLRSDHLVVLELVDKIPLAMLAEQVELYLAGDLRPLELV